VFHINNLYLCGRKIVVVDGRRTDFWGDPWCGFTPLKKN
jgi:hypothetical protein